jgi:signal transduction histidine kinase/CheY-like chemotaxis protein/putative methionine-R-sulfoxide reductase with GAF domain
MGGDQRSLDDLWAALSRLTRRLDDLAMSLGRLDPGGLTPAGEPLDEAARSRLAPLESLLAIGPHLGQEAASLLAVDRAIHHAGAEYAALFLPDAEGALAAQTWRGFPSRPLRIHAGEGIVGRAFRDGETIRAAPDHQASDALLHDPGILHALAVPVRVAGARPVGVLFAGRRRPAPFPDDALGTLTLLAERLGLTLATAPPAAEPPTDALELAGDLDLERTAARVVRRLATRLGATRAALFVPDGGGVRLVSAWGGPAEPLQLSPPPGPLAAALGGARAAVLGPGERDPVLDRLVATEVQGVIPLARDGRVAAVLVAGSAQPLAVGALGELGTLAAAAIENARLHAETVAGLHGRQEAERARPPDVPEPVRNFASLLAVVLARVGLAREQARDPRLAADLRVAEEAAWRAAEAVRSLLGFAPGRPDTPELPLDLGLVIREAVEEARRGWASRPTAPPGITLDLAPLPPIRGDADDLREALRHLLDNAAEAVPAGSLITVRARWDGRDRVEVLVEDAGVGMDEEVRARALEPFFSTKGPGRLGLGLPVVQAIVAHHRGTLELVSVPQAGTTVRLGFPTASGAAAHSVPASRSGTAARILVVEDDAAVREALVALFRRERHAVLAAAEGAEAVEVARREVVDVLLVDLDLPGPSGLEVAREVRRVRPRARAILLTAWPGSLDGALLTAAGIDRVLEKPAGVDEVLAALEAVLADRPTFRS